MWNCEPCTPLKYWPGVHSYHYFSFWLCSPFCYMSLSPYVYLWPCLFMPLLPLYILILQVKQQGKKGLYFTLCRQVMWKTTSCCWAQWKVSSSSVCWSQLLGFSVSQCHAALWHLALWHCSYFYCVFCPPSHARQGLLMPLLPLTLPQWVRDSLCSLSPSNPRRTTLVHWRWIQGAAFGGADTAALFHWGPH